MNEKKFLELLKTHDWYYERSDDYKHYKKGKAERTNINLAMHEKPELRVVFAEYVEDKKISLF